MPRLRELIAEKMRNKNGIPIEIAEEVLVTNGGTTALYVVLPRAARAGRRGDRSGSRVAADRWRTSWRRAACRCGCRCTRSSAGAGTSTSSRRAITPKTRVLYLNSPNNPTGGVLTRADLERLAAIARERNLWVISDEAYEDVVFEGEHVSIASLPGMYERTIPLYTFSKSYAMTGVRVGYFAIKDAAIRDAREEDGALHRQQRRVGRAVRRHRRARRVAAVHRRTSATELRARRDLFYDGIAGRGARHVLRHSRRPARSTRS